MALRNDARPEERVRHIQEETEQLGRQVGRAAEAAHKALAADSLASANEDYSEEPDEDSAGLRELGPESERGAGKPPTWKRVWMWSHRRKGKAKA